MKIPRLHIGVVSTRLAGTDGVSLESAKWSNVLTESGHTCYYFAGECDRPTERSRTVPEAHFSHELVEQTNQDLFHTCTTRSPQTSDAIHELRIELKKSLRSFIDDFDIQLLIVENALSIPMNVPLGLALTELIAETNIPTIAHHHDFSWERERFKINAAEDYLHAAFPPSMSTICHVVINTCAAEELARRTGMRSSVIPNVMDFDHPPPEVNQRADSLREALQVSEDEVLLLQPTRIVPRKCIERSIELARWLALPASLVVSHDSGDEGTDYQTYLEEYARALNVRLIFGGDKFAHEEDLTGHDNGRYALSDAYHKADLVTYPSRVEGFGNAFLEAIYYHRPLMMCSYEIFRADIQPKGFRVIDMGSHLTPEMIESARRVVCDADYARQMTEHNFQLARQHYSYTVLRDRLETLLQQYRSRLGLNPSWH
jgi:glycosyltransferase involved in cell wall biosynthesis